MSPYNVVEGWVQFPLVVYVPEGRATRPRMMVARKNVFHMGPLKTCKVCSALSRR